jgi:SAM-dependent methyltransferase
MPNQDQQQSDPYILKSATRADLELARLRSIEEIYDPGTRKLLGSLGMAGGWSCLEVGAGAGSIARTMAEAVGCAGKVIATEIDRTLLADLAHPGVRVIEHDITRDHLPTESWDLIHVRSVLEHLPSPTAAVSQLVSSLVRGGRLLVEAIDVSDESLDRAAQQAPNSKAATAFLQFSRAVNQLMVLTGADPELGTRLADILTEHGLERVEHERRHPLVPGGSRGFYALTYARLAPAFRKHGLISTADDHLTSTFDDRSATFPAVPIVAAFGYAPAAV